MDALATIGLCIVQGIGEQYIGTMGLVYPESAANPVWWIMATAALTAERMFLMWLGEQIDKHGIGNGVSLIIAAGILTQMPSASAGLSPTLIPAIRRRSRNGQLVFFIIAGFVVVIAVRCS